MTIIIRIITNQIEIEYYISLPANTELSEEEEDQILLEELEEEDNFIDALRNVFVVL